MFDIHANDRVSPRLVMGLIALFVAVLMILRADPLKPRVFNTESAKNISASVAEPEVKFVPVKAFYASQVPQRYHAYFTTVISVKAAEATVIPYDSLVCQADVPGKLLGTRADCDLFIDSERTVPVPASGLKVQAGERVYIYALIRVPVDSPTADPHLDLLGLKFRDKLKKSGSIAFQ